MSDSAAKRQRFTEEEVAAMLARGACMCGIEDAERYPLDHARTVVPTSPNCAWMNMTGACPKCNNAKQTVPMLQFLLQRLEVA